MFVRQVTIEDDQGRAASPSCVAALEDRLHQHVLQNPKERAKSLHFYYDVCSTIQCVFLLLLRPSKHSCNDVFYEVSLWRRRV